MTVTPSDIESRKPHFCDFCWQTIIFDSALFQDAYAYWSIPKADQHGNPNKDGPSLIHVINWRVLRTNADCGCRWCSMLCSLIQAENRVLRNEKIRFTIRVQPAHRMENPPGLNIMTMLAERAGLRSQRSLEQDMSIEPVKSLIAAKRARLFHIRLGISTDLQSPAAHVITSRQLHHIVSDSTVVEQTHKWLATCANHPSCGGTYKRPFPSRLIDLRADSGPKLIECVNSEGYYAAISYCWGGQQAGTLCKANEKRYLKRIEPSELSATLRDAIKITADIGVQFLWIDALCIVQDSEEDKSKEIGLMSEIYSNALFTLTVVSSASASDGFLQNRKAPDLVIPASFRIPNGQRANIMIAQYDRGPEMDEQPLQRRAWAFQEWVMSRRRLIFDSDTVKWHCQELSENMGSSLRHQQWWSFSQDWQSIAELQEDDDYLNYWTRAVREYSRRSLTFPQDKLSAISAIAKNVSKLWKCKYFAGLFEKHFVYQLIWDAEHLPSKPSVYRAPSWSWASYDGWIIFYFLNGNPDPPPQILCTPISCKVTCKNPQEVFGEVVYAELTIRARKKTSSELVAKRKKSFDLTVADAIEEAVVGETATLLLASNKDGFWGMEVSPTIDGKWRRVGLRTGKLEDIIDAPYEDVTII